LRRQRAASKKSRSNAATLQARLAPVGLVGRSPAHVGEHEQALVAGISGLRAWKQ
jgi:hypothetical protein